MKTVWAVCVSIVLVIGAFTITDTGDKVAVWLLCLFSISLVWLVLGLQKRVDFYNDYMIRKRRPMRENEKLNKDKAKIIALEFFYWWHNQPGTNTADGFDEWWNKKQVSGNQPNNN